MVYLKGSRLRNYISKDSPISSTERGWKCKDKKMKFGQWVRSRREQCNDEKMKRLKILLESLADVGCTSQMTHQLV